MKKIQSILEEIMEISRIPMILYDAGANCLVALADTAPAIQDNVQDFIHSDVDSQTLGTYHYFKVISSETLSYVLLVPLRSDS